MTAHKYLSDLASRPCQARGCEGGRYNGVQCADCVGTGWRPRISQGLKCADGTTCSGMNIAGVRFGALIAINVAFKNKIQESVWDCECDCGSTTKAKISYLTGGKRNACYECIPAYGDAK